MWGAPEGTNPGWSPEPDSQPPGSAWQLDCLACEAGLLTLPELSVTQCFLGQDTAHAEFIVPRCLVSQALLAGQDTGVSVPQTSDGSGPQLLSCERTSLPSSFPSILALIPRRCCSFSPIVQSFSHVRLCNPMDCSTPGFPALHHLPELAQTHVH